MTHLDAPPVRVDSGPRTLRLGRAATFGLAFAAYDLAYILSPYWRMAHSPGLQLILLGVTVLVGVAWAFAAAGGLEIILSARSAWLLSGALVVLGCLNARAITQGIAFRGDEDLHIDRSLKLLIAMSGKRSLVSALLLVTGIIIVVAALYCRAIWQAAVVCLVAVGAQALLLGAYHTPTLITPMRLIRYPLFETWFSVPFSLLAKLVLSTTPPWHGRLTEAVFRATPFFSAVLLAWYGGRKLAPGRPVAQALFALAIGTTPLVYYYSSVTYLEMPAVGMMTVVCFGATALLTGGADAVRRQRGWYALLMIGFLKETALPFLVAFVGCRAALTLLAAYRGDRTWREVCNDLLIGFAVMTPLAVYLFYRSFSPVKRDVSPQLVQLLKGEYYAVLLKAYAQQFGPLALLAVAGVGVMVARRQFAVLFFFAVAFAADAGLHLIDDHAYIGYSRFNLFLLPMAIAAAWHAVDTLCRFTAPVAWGALALVIGGNLALVPIHLDGSKKAGWGQYYFDTTDHSYPYRETIQWINQKHHEDRVLFAGMWFKYPVRLYLRRGMSFDAPSDRNWFGSDDTRSVEAALAQARSDGFTLVVYHLYDMAPPQMHARNMAGFRQVKLFQNAAHALVVYEQMDPSAKGATTAPAKTDAEPPEDAPP